MGPLEVIVSSWFDSVVGVGGAERYGSAYRCGGDKLACLLIFWQFLEELLPKIIAVLERDTKRNNQVVEDAREALAPFLPYLVAEELAA